nr:uncharacterized protein LOC113693168 [Coffea arabica]
MFMEEIVDHHSMKVKGFKKSIKKKYNLNCTNSQMYRAKEKAEEAVKGSYAKMFARLRDYCATLLQKNPSSVAFLVTEKSQLCKSPIFKRMFVMFTTQKKDFVNTCKPVIGLDACHLKMVMGGQLMFVICKDANNQMFPITMALVESECKDSWGWFLDSLTDAIGTPLERGWVFLSDRQKGLIDFIKNMYSELSIDFTLGIFQMSCICNEWKMTGIPCVHACVGLVQDNKNPYAYVDNCYSVKTYKKAYS